MHTTMGTEVHHGKGELCQPKLVSIVPNSVLGHLRRGAKKKVSEGGHD